MDRGAWRGPWGRKESDMNERLKKKKKKNKLKKEIQFFTFKYNVNCRLFFLRCSLSD